MSQSNPIEEKLRQFALAVREFGKSLPMTVANVEDLKELTRSSGAIGASYIEATGAINRNDYLIGLKKCVTDTRNTHYWLSLVDSQGQPEIERKRKRLMELAEEMRRGLTQLIQQSKP